MTSKAFKTSLQPFLRIISEERTSSTHALTMYRHTAKVGDAEYKVGKSLKMAQTVIGRVYSRKLTLERSNESSLTN